MEAVATHLDETTGYFVTHFDLQQRIGQAEAMLDQRFAAAHATRSGRSCTAASPAGGAGTLPQWLARPSRLRPKRSQSKTRVTSIRRSLPSSREEALELIDASEHSLSDWRTDPSSADYRSALKRPLHTLKGGARMAGITAMGDLSHELEIARDEVDNGSVAADDAVFDTIQASLDELARMREAVSNGRRVSQARAIIARIHALSRGEALPATASRRPPRRAAAVPHGAVPPAGVYRADCGRRRAGDPGRGGHRGRAVACF